LCYNEIEQEADMRQDRFLSWILVGIGAVILIALGLFFFRRVEVTYLPEDTPAGVLNNYALALHQADYPRAYQYLAAGKNQPSYPDFRQSFLTDTSLSGASLIINETTAEKDEAVVGVTILTSNGPFADTNRLKENASLLRQNGVWKISQAPYPYWRWEWLQTPVKATPQ
jgi:hypothetical protein